MAFLNNSILIFGNMTIMGLSIGHEFLFYSFIDVYISHMISSQKVYIINKSKIHLVFGLSLLLCTIHF